MHARSAAARLWVDIEDRLIPLLRLTTHERALYYHLLRRTRLVGRRLIRVSRRRMARASGLSTATARHYLRVLARKQCIRFVDRGPDGSLVSVLLPDEILAKLGPAVAPPADNSPLASLPHLLERDAAGQPRAWPRSDHFRNDEFRARILKRDRHRCFYCRQPLLPGDWTLDHVVPVVRGGSDRASNLAACCARCNWAKGLYYAEDFLRGLHDKGVIPRKQLHSRLKALAVLASGAVAVFRRRRLAPIV